MCLRCRRGITLKRTVQLGGAAPDGKIYLSLMIKEERFIICRGQRHDCMGRKGHRDAEDKGMVSGRA
jgi:hypothetical protein